MDGPKRVLIVGVGSLDVLRALAERDGIDLDQVMDTMKCEIGEMKSIPIVNTLPPIDIKSVRAETWRERPAHERIAAQKGRKLR